MPQSAIESNDSFDKIHEGHPWRSSKPGLEERLVRLTQQQRPALRVFISDRDSMGSDLLASALTLHPRCEAVAIEQSNLLQALATSEVDLVVIGVGLNSKSESGFDLANAVCRAYPNIYVVILLNETTHVFVINAFRSGARGVFSRQLSMTDFLECVEQVGKGMIWVGRDETSALLEAFKSIPAPNILSATSSPALTDRELQVVQGAAKGKTNKTIASELRLSEHTVKNYLFRAFDKLGVSSRVELLFYLTIRGHTFGSTSSESSNEDSGIE
jgi:two-component system, NarL family, nitrate/nitrite response regulator NarL